MKRKTKSRYQFYLDDSLAEQVAQMGDSLGVSRSQLVRDAMASLVTMYQAKTTKPDQIDYRELFELSGIITTSSSRLSTQVNEIYAIDDLKERHGLS